MVHSHYFKFVNTRNYGKGEGVKLFMVKTVLCYSNSDWLIDVLNNVFCVAKLFW